MADERYEPTSDFLRAAMNVELSFGEHVYGQDNLARLIDLTRDAEAVNRDWATMLLAQTEEDSPAIRQAFRDRLNDPHKDTRMEALLGLAARDREGALPFVAAWLAGDLIDSLVLEAAALVADVSLLTLLDEIAASWRGDDPGEAIMHDLAMARRACADGMPRRWRDDG